MIRYWKFAPPLIGHFIFLSLTLYVIWEPLLFEVIELDDGNGAFMSREGKRRKRRRRWRGGKEEEGRYGRRNEGGKKKFANGQQLVVYSFGHGFLDTGLDRCYQPIYQNRSVLLYLLPFLASATVDETGPVAHFPFVSHQLLLLIYSWTSYSTCRITYRQNLFFTLPRVYSALDEWTSFFVI